MKRSSWLALGAIGAALVVGGLAPSAALLLGLGAACAAAALAGRLGNPRNGRGNGLTPLALGALIIVIRAAGGLVLAPNAADMQLDAGALASGRHEGVIVSVGTPDGGLQRAVVELRPPEPAGRVYAWLPRYPSVAQADLITFTGRLEQPPPSGDFADFLARSAVTATIRARTLERLGVDGSPLAALEGIRRTAADLLARVLPEPQSGLAAAMAIGLRDAVSRDVSDDFRTAGLSHVVAISGCHIALVGAVVAALLGGLPRRQRSALVLLAIVAYAILAGASPSILRAALMASVVIVARESGRRGQATAGLALDLCGPAAARSSDDHRRRLPAVRSRHRRSAGVGDAAARLADQPPAGPDSDVAARGPRRVARGAGRDPAPRPVSLRPAVARRAALQPAHGAARRAGDAA